MPFPFTRRPVRVCYSASIPLVAMFTPGIAIEAPQNSGGAFITNLAVDTIDVLGFGVSQPGAILDTGRVVIPEVTRSNLDPEAAPLSVVRSGYSAQVAVAPDFWMIHTVMPLVADSPHRVEIFVSPGMEMVLLLDKASRALDISIMIDEF